MVPKSAPGRYSDATTSLTGTGAGPADTAEFGDRPSRLDPLTRYFTHAEGLGIRMQQALIVEYGVLVGVVLGAGANQRGHECGLAAEARSRDDDALAAMSNRAGVKEEMSR